MSLTPHMKIIKTFQHHHCNLIRIKLLNYRTPPPVVIQLYSLQHYCFIVILIKQNMFLFGIA